MGKTKKNKKIKKAKKTLVLKSDKIYMHSNPVSEAIDSLEPKYVHNGLLHFSDLPLDYKPAGEQFSHTTMRLRRTDMEFLKQLSKDSGQPMWVITKSLVETFMAMHNQLVSDGHT